MITFAQNSIGQLCRVVWCIGVIWGLNVNDNKGGGGEYKIVLSSNMYGGGGWGGEAQEIIRQGREGPKVRTLWGARNIREIQKLMDLALVIIINLSVLLH